MVNKLNVVWIYVDSVRRHHSSDEAILQGDDRSRLDYMDEFSKESVEFINTVTSAPSTQMSISAMASSLPSYYIASTFEDYFNQQFLVSNLIQSVKKKNIEICGFLQSRRNREFHQKIFANVKKSFWPKGYSHNDYWSNEQINNLIRSTLNKITDTQKLFFVNYNCRNDPKTSFYVKEAIQMFRSAGFSKDNTIIILTSDHGYPKFEEPTGRPEYYIKNKLTHDLILSDDNIMIPLLIQFPNCPEGMKVDTTVSSLDIFPTILDLLGIKINAYIEGISLLDLISAKSNIKSKFHDRYFRTDSRLAFQSGKATSIRNHTYKYIFYADNIRNKGPEEFFNIANDPLENHNLINCEETVIKDKIKLFRTYFNHSEDTAAEFIKKLQIKRNSTKLNKLYRRVNLSLPFIIQEPLFIMTFLKEFIIDISKYIKNIFNKSPKYKNR